MMSAPGGAIGACLWVAADALGFCGWTGVGTGLDWGLSPATLGRGTGRSCLVAGGSCPVVLPAECAWWEQGGSVPVLVSAGVGQGGQVTAQVDAGQGQSGLWQSGGWLQWEQQGRTGLDSGLGG